MSSLMESVRDFVVKFVSRMSLKGTPGIRNGEEASASLAQIGRWRIEILQGEAALAKKILQLQEELGARLAPAREGIQRELTRLRDYAQPLCWLDSKDGSSQTLHLSTGRLSFYHGPVRASVPDEPQLLEDLQDLPEGHPLSVLVSFPPPPPPKLDRDLLVREQRLIADINQELATAKPVTLVRALFFAAFPTAQPGLKEGLKIVGKVREEKVAVP